MNCINYSLAKTLRFALIPQGNTRQNIDSLISEDEKRSQDYQIAKKGIDAYHRYFISDVLSKFLFSDEDLLTYQQHYQATIKSKNKSSEEKLKFEKVCEDLRKKVVKAFDNDLRKKNLFTADLLKKELPKALESSDVSESSTSSNKDVYDDFESSAESSLNVRTGFTLNTSARQALEGFKKFTAYFLPYQETRKNVYSSEKQATAISYRIVHENLPKFLVNLETFSKIQDVLSYDDLRLLEKNLYQEISCFSGKEEENVSLESIFTLSMFNKCLTQQGIDLYNSILGGKTIDSSDSSDSAKTLKIQGINELINLYNQKQKDKRKRLPRLIPLYKQILGNGESFSFLPPQFESYEQVLEALHEFYTVTLSGADLSKSVLTNILHLTNDLQSYDDGLLYIPVDASLNMYSQKFFGDYSLIEKSLSEDSLDKHKDGGATRKTTSNSRKNSQGNSKTKESKLFKRFKDQGYISIADLSTYVDAYKKQLAKDADDTEISLTAKDSILRYFREVKVKGLDPQLKDAWQTYPAMSVVQDIEQKYEIIQGLCQNTHAQKPLPVKPASDHIQKIKLFLDSVKEFYDHFKVLKLSPEITVEKDLGFYESYEKELESLSSIVGLYNKVRNFMTKKPYSEAKFKLTLNYPTLLNGWSLSKEKDNRSMLLRRQGQYYLAIYAPMEKKSKKETFVDLNSLIVKEGTQSTDDDYQKMVYNLLPDPKRMLPKVFFSKDWRSSHDIPEVIESIRKDESFKITSSNFRLSSLHQLIDYYKDSIKKYPSWDVFDLKFKPTEDYKDINEFYGDIQKKDYKVDFYSIKKADIDQLVEDGKLLLFHIYNKDYSTKSHRLQRTPNMHTLYWEELFSPENLENPLYKLSGEAEMFYRAPSIEKKVNKPTHPAGENIKNKGPFNPNKLKSTFSYDLIKDKRYTEERFSLFIPISVNYRKPSAPRSKAFNVKCLQEIAERKEAPKFIALDRGERHLLYLSVIDDQGKILEQKSYNVLTPSKDSPCKIDYHYKLDKLEEERDKARKDWQSISAIKDLKEGYLSIVVADLARLMVEHKAMLFLEDLNFGFKRGRFKVEKQVYQKFEKALIDKLNYLVFKDQKDKNAPGGIRNAYQLTAPFDTFQSLGKQSGYLFYVPAWNTSKIDPTTGFVNLLDTHYTNVEKAREFFKQFESICYNAQEDYFEFALDYRKFATRVQVTHPRWTVCTHGANRYKYDSSQKTYQQVNVTEEMKALFQNEGIALDSDLKQSLEQAEKPLLSSVMYYLGLTLAMRYSTGNSDEPDLMISPVKNKSGKFFMSHGLTKDSGLPIDPDANGAYHIALKGLYLYNKIKNTPIEELDKVNLTVSNEEWLTFAQDRTC